MWDSRHLMNRTFMTNLCFNSAYKSAAILYMQPLTPSLQLGNYQLSPSGHLGMMFNLFCATVQPSLSISILNPLLNLIPLHQPAKQQVFLRSCQISIVLNTSGRGSSEIHLLNSSYFSSSPLVFSECAPHLKS